MMNEIPSQNFGIFIALPLAPDYISKQVLTKFVNSELKMTPQDIQNIRLAYNLTPAQFAQTLAISRPTVYAWESGRTIPGPHERMILWRLAEATHNPHDFDRTFRAIMHSLTYQQAAPAPTASPNVPNLKKDSNSTGMAALAFGLGALLGVLFAKSNDNSKS